MVQIQKPVEKNAAETGAEQGRSGSAFPPLRDEAPSPQETEAFRNEAFQHYHEVLSQLADS